jgi:hypothetical protein
MNEQQKETLHALRIAIEQDQRQLCREILAQLLTDLKKTDSIKIIVKQAQQFLSDLFQAHPQDDSLGKAVEGFNNITSLEALDQQGRLVDPLLDKYWNLPGVSNFRNAFKGLSKPQQYFNHSGEYIDTLVSILSSILLAIVMNKYWSSDPEFSKTFFGPDVKKAIFMLAEHHSNPKQIALRASLWLEIVDEIDNALRTR